MNLDHFSKRLTSLKKERIPFDRSAQQISTYIGGNRGRFFTDETNEDQMAKSRKRILNNTAMMAARDLSAGMMAGLTSPARPWFKLESPNKELNELQNVKAYNLSLESIFYKVFSQSNIYNSLFNLYTELPGYGIAAMGVYEDDENFIRTETYTYGTYWVGVGAHGIVDTFYREYQLSVAQTIKEFGYENCSMATKNLWDSGGTEQWVKIIHAIEPNDDRDQTKVHAKNKKYRSVYFEESLTEDRGEDKFLKVSGFDEFPILAPRWDVVPGDVYGTNCPGMMALGDTLALQLGEEKLYRAVNILVDPPLLVPASLRAAMEDGPLKEGQKIFVDGVNPGEMVTPLYGNYRPDINAIQAINFKAEERIKKSFYIDLFLMISNTADRERVTAREIAEKSEEKLLMLGPVLERLQHELYDPLISRVYSILGRAFVIDGDGNKSKVLPSLPVELRNSPEYKVNYISILAQAQRSVATSGMEDVLGFTSNVSSIWPEARHKIDALQVIDEYASSRGVPPKIIRGDQDVEAILAQEAEAAAAAQQRQEQMEMAQMTKNVGSAKVGPDTLLGSTLGG